MLSRLAPRLAAVAAARPAASIMASRAALCRSALSLSRAATQLRSAAPSRAFTVSCARLQQSSSSPSGGLAASQESSARPNSIVVTAAGPDRAGIVHDLSSALSAIGANVEESRMTILGGEFAILLRITSPESVDAAAIRERLESHFSDFIVTARPTSSTPPLFDGPVRIFSVAIEGPDQPGVVQSLTKALLDHQASIRDLDTDTTTAPFAGYKLFALKCVVALPINANFDSLRDAIQKFEDDYGFDVDMQEGMQDEAEDEMDDDEDIDDMDDDEPDARHRRYEPAMPQQAPARRPAAAAAAPPMPPRGSAGMPPLRGPAGPARGPMPGPASRAAPTSGPARGPAGPMPPRGPSRR